MSSNTDELASIPYEVINDKSLNTQDYLFKLIIIGDTGKYLIHAIYVTLYYNRCWKELSSLKSNG